ncbi:MAG: hypothetical protein KJP05_09125 [Deltaproteobacteria bacterium]|nr:hypothetical protein [Deltaproteobacteria bacterium]
MHNLNVRFRVRRSLTESLETNTDGYRRVLPAWSSSPAGCGCVANPESGFIEAQWNQSLESFVDAELEEKRSLQNTKSPLNFRSPQH